VILERERAAALRQPVQTAFSALWLLRYPLAEPFDD